MKKFFSLFISLLIFILCSFPVFAENNIVSAKSAVVICADTAEVIYSKNMNEKLPMASTTKIMTAILALEYGASEFPYTVTKDMISVEGTSMGLKDGDTVSLKTLVKGMLLESGNDAANATAIIVGGSIPSFLAMMNDKAKEIGMKSTSFGTVSGLDSENHYSTAYDMALLGAYALKNPEFRSICSSKSQTVYFGNPPYRRTLTNHNKLLSFYDDAFGIKTGFTKKSGRCLVSAAEKDGKTLVAVTLNASDDWNDHKKLFDYTFEKVNSYQLSVDLSNLRLRIVGGDRKSISVSASNLPNFTTQRQNFNYNSKILIKHFEYAPVYKGDIVGKAEFFDENGSKIGETSICAEESVSVAVNENSARLNESKKNFFDKVIDLFRR